MRDSRGSYRQPRTRILIAIAAVLFTVTVVFGGYRLLNPRSEFGTCFVLSNTCRHVPMATVERYSGLQFPQGTTRISSASDPGGSLGYKPAYVSATLQLPPHGNAKVVSPGLGADANAPADPAQFKAELRDAGATHIHVLTNDGSTIVLTGQRGTDRLMLVYVAFRNN